jgi:hypothetical protein
MTTRPPHAVTARAIASRHPDPRVRILFVKATPAMEPKESDLMSGRPWKVSSEDKALTFHELPLELSSWERRQHDGFWAFFLGPNAEISNLMDEDGSEYRGTSYEDFPWSASDIAVMEPLPLSSFPPLGIPNASAQQTIKKSWGKTSAEASLRVDSDQTPSISGIGTISRKVKQLEKQVETEPLPQLRQTDVTSNNTATDLWARFAKDRVSQSASQPQRTSGMASVRKPSKKKKWEPLLI